MVIVAVTFVGILLNYVLGNDSAEVKSDVALITLPIIGGCILADVIVKKSFGWKLLWIWITEMLLLLVVVYLWIIAK